jgi:hypothetical protein
MRARWGAALAAAVTLAASAAARAGDDGTCELSRVDRRHTSSRSCMTCHDGSNPHLPNLNGYDNLKKKYVATLGVAVVAHEGSTVLVVLNALRLLVYKRALLQRHPIPAIRG